MVSDGSRIVFCVLFAFVLVVFALIVFIACLSFPDADYWSFLFPLCLILSALGYFVDANRLHQKMLKQNVSLFDTVQYANKQCEKRFVNYVCAANDAVFRLEPRV